MRANRLVREKLMNRLGRWLGRWKLHVQLRMGGCERVIDSQLPLGTQCPQGVRVFLIVADMHVFAIIFFQPKAIHLS